LKWQSESFHAEAVGTLGKFPSARGKGALIWPALSVRAAISTAPARLDPVLGIDRVDDNAGKPDRNLESQVNNRQVERRIK
jgi:hypothetical protein